MKKKKMNIGDKFNKYFSKGTAKGMKSFPIISYILVSKLAHRRSKHIRISVWKEFELSRKKEVGTNGRVFFF